MSVQGPSSTLDGELHYLIAKYLANGPCTQAGQVLIEELERNEMIPPRLNWLGQSFKQDFKTYDAKLSHIRPDHLIKMLEKLIKDSDTARESHGNATGLDVMSNRSLLVRRIESLSLGNDVRLQQSMRSPNAMKTSLNCVQRLFGREVTGRGVSCEILKPTFYSSRINLACRTLGHLSAVYCVLTDMTGKYIFTGADDKLVKIWSSEDGRLLFTLRGCSSEITDLAVNFENTLLASSCNDRLIHVWCLSTGEPIATLTAQSGSITSVYFCPMPRSRSCIRYLASTSTDGSCAFWSYTEEPGRKAKFAPLPTIYNERMRPGHAQMICASFSAGGVFMAAGSADNNVRVYYMLGTDGPERILEVENHADRVDSISFAHRGVRFISGSRDGTALVWRYQRQQWRFVRILCNKQAIGDPPVINNADPKQKLRVTMVGWNADDTLVLTAISNRLIKVWNPLNGNCVRVLRNHKDEVFCIEPNPIYPRIICTAGHDGHLFVWDIGTVDDEELESGKELFHYFNDLPDLQGFGAIFDVKWTPDGFSFAATDSHGHLMIFNTTQNDKFSRLPGQIFFHTDYRPLFRDAMNNATYDEQTHVEPHLMPPPFLVDVDGNPYPPDLQRLVPGRERCKDEQLIPTVAEAPGGYQEVIEGLPAAPAIPNAPTLPTQNQNPRSNIEELIAQLAAEQGAPPEIPVLNGALGSENRPGEARGIANRRSGEVEGIRQSRGNWHAGNSQGLLQTRHVVPRFGAGLLVISEQVRHAFGDEEDQYYQEQKKLQPSPSDIANTLNVASIEGRSSREIRSRRIRQLAAVAAEQRRLGELAQAEQNAMEGIARPNPPQQEISLPQNPPAIRRGFARRTGGIGVHTLSSTNRRRRRARYSLRVDNSDQVHQSDHESSESSISSSDLSESSSSDSEFSDSDWGGTPNTSPKKASMSTERKRTTRNASSSPPEVKQEAESDVDFEEPEDPKPGPSSRIVVKGKVEQSKPRPVRKARRAVVEVGGLEEIDEKYRPSEWLSELVPKKSPYFPQLGDDLVYFRQGHNLYLDEVKARNIYPMSNKYLKSLPWVTHPLLPTEVPVRVVAINFEIKPPRLVRLKLATTDWETGELTGSYINNVAYHDVSSVVDFLVLRQLYDKSMRHKWNPGNRFRCLIDRVWWIGTIKSVEPLSSNFPHSKFLCFSACWTSGDTEKLSPWDLDVIPDDFEIPEDETDEGVPATEEELHSDLYEPNGRDWPPFGHQDAECQRIAGLVEDVMGLAYAEHFLTPVDLNKYPEYIYEIAYPVDLNTIKTRLENRFYRRLDALKFDIKHIALNAEQFNRPLTDIVKKARIIRDLCLQISCQPELTEVTGTYHTLVKNFKWEKVVEPTPSTSASPGTSKLKLVRQVKNSRDVTEPAPHTNGRSVLGLRPRNNLKIRRIGREINGEIAKSWQERCKELLDKMWQSRDSEPFRQPVNPVEYQDYYVRIDTPMDLMSVKEDLLGGNYSTPHEFARDMRLVFSNSRTYNTDKHSRIYIMTVRLNSMFDCNMAPILEDYRGRRNRTRKRDSVIAARTPTKANSSNGLRYSRRSLSETPRKNPRRSAATKNPYVYQENSSGLEEEPVADGDQYRDHRRRRRRSSQQQKRVVRPSRNSSGRQQNDQDHHPHLRPTRKVKRLRISSGEQSDQPVLTKEEPADSAESSDAEEEQPEPEEELNCRKGRRRSNGGVENPVIATRRSSRSNNTRQPAQQEEDHPHQLRPRGTRRPMTRSDPIPSDHSGGSESELEEQAASEEQEEDSNETSEEEPDLPDNSASDEDYHDSSSRWQGTSRGVKRSLRSSNGRQTRKKYYLDDDEDENEGDHQNVRSTRRAKRSRVNSSGDSDSKVSSKRTRQSSRRFK